MIETLTFNKNNWTGESASITIENNEFELNGDRFRLVFTILDDSEFEKAELFEVLPDDSLAEYPICVAVKWHHPQYGKYWEFFHHEVREGNLSRRHENPFIASAQIVCNVW